MKTVSNRIQDAIDAVLYAAHGTQRVADESKNTELAIIYARLDDIFKELKGLKNTVDRVASQIE